MAEEEKTEPAESAESAQATATEDPQAPAEAPQSSDVPQAAGAAADDEIDVQEADLPEATEPASTAPGGQIDLLLAATMSVSASLGQVEMEVRELLQLGPGSIVHLDRPVGSPVDLFLRGVKFATGKLVVVGDQLGVRIEAILPPAERAERARS